MNKVICQKCGGKISNEFGVTLAYCTNCGAGIQNLQMPETAALGESPTLVSPNSPNYNLPSNSNRTRYFLGCLGLGFGAIMISAIGIFGYWSWSGKNPLATCHYSKKYFTELSRFQLKPRR